MVGIGECVGLSFIHPKDMEKKPNFLGINLAMAVAKLPKRGIPKYS